MTEDELILIPKTLAGIPGPMTALCVSDDGYAFGFASPDNPADYFARRGFAYVDGELMFFEDYLMINGVAEADSWSTYCVNSVTPDGKTFLGAANMKGLDYSFVVTIGEPNCAAPDNLTYTIDENNYSSITLMWDAPENAENVTYEIYTSYTEIDPIYQGITETSFTIENLEAGYYKYVVKANWNGECLSNPSNAVEPIIYPCDTKDMCEITFEMLDGYGDGWNGAFIYIAGSNNDFSYSVGLEKEGLETVTKTIALCPDNYTFVWNWGEFDEEISFSIVFNDEKIFEAKPGSIDYLFPTYFLEYEVNCGEDITETEQTSSLDLYPNPVQDKLYIEAEAVIEEVVVYDVYGRVQNLRNSETQKLRNSIDVSDLNSGVYFVQIKTEEGNITKRFVKE
jgi:hypothetical protein